MTTTKAPDRLVKARSLAVSAVGELEQVREQHFQHERNHGCANTNCPVRHALTVGMHALEGVLQSQSAIARRIAHGGERLGENQRAVLKLMAQPHQDHYPGAGWVYGTKSQTIRILESLYERGLVDRAGSQYYPRFTLNDVGREVAVSV